jgi:Galactose binding lectin domain
MCFFPVELKEYCEAETFNASCADSQVLLIREALYGRMRLGRCVIHDYGYVGCFADVASHLDALCSGNRTCRIHIPDAELDRANPCPKDFKTYLEVSYECVTGPEC